MNALEDDIRGVLHSQAEAMHVPEGHPSSPLSHEGVIPQQPPMRRWMLAAAVVLMLILLVAGVALAQLRTDAPGTEKPITRSATTAAAAASTISNGWVAFAAGYPDGDIYLVQEGSPAYRIAGSDTDGIDQTCPAFSPDGTQLVYGQATGNESERYEDEELVITDLTADGVPSATVTIALDGTSLLPCAIWSADGRWVAFGAGIHNRAADPQFVDEVWVIDTDTEDIRRLTGLTASDLEWAPDATELFIASDGIVVYSVETDETRPLGDTAGVETFTLSPDGQRIAFERTDPDPPDVPSSPGPGAWPLDQDLWLMDADGTDERILAADYARNHGIGPVWSPDGDHIAYQRQCAYTSANSGLCREGHVGVVVAVSEKDALEPAGTQTIIPAPETNGPDGPTLWAPFSVTWSPDSTTLLYIAWNDRDGAGLVAVRVDGETPPIVLDDTVEPSVYGGYPWLPFQSWSRHRD